MTKKYFKILFFICGSPFLLAAQQRPQYTQYIFNNYLINPALGGIENYTDIRLGHRQQWAGLENAPTTSFVSAHWAIGDNYLWKNPLSLPDVGEDPMRLNYMQNYASSPSHHGVGLMAVSDKAGAISRIDAGVSYAYHLQTSGIHNLSVGAYLGATRLSLDANAIKFETQFDPAASSIATNRLMPDLGMGVWFHGARFFAGLSAQQIIGQKFSFNRNTDENLGKLVPHLFLTSGYKLFWDDDISILPSFMLKQVHGLPISLDLNAKVSYQDRVWLGGSYRNSDSFSAIVGFNLKNFVNLTYAYDITTSALNTVSNGSHEIVLGFQLNNTYKVFSKGPF